ncbi:MAG: SusC/RagA family TonB-linked outer membrane protein [Bacteroidales bacterium]|nr:SusC/RagA family TonB-linked outer membrane protein [Bacteroidales bacterium]
MKILSYCPFFWKSKTFLIMKMTTLLLTVNLMQIAATTFSQSTRFDLSFEQTPLKEALTTIENQSTYKFVYRESDIENKTVTLTASDLEIVAVLDGLLSNTENHYRILENNLVIIASNEVLQQNRITGTITDGATGEPLIGVNVSIEGTQGGTTSDASGRFTINAAPGDMLVFSYIGYLSEKVEVSGQTVIDISMSPNIQELDEVVVVGYGTQRKSDVTGSLVRVTNKDLQLRPVSNAFEALQGKAAGVDITSNERPGEIGTVRIRGVRSLATDANKRINDPLYVVDGVPIMSSSGIETLNPRDIASVDILKDASATAIYGSRGANGVILITTNRGQAGKMTFNYTGNVTIENLQDKAEMMNASEYLTWRRWAYYNMDPAIYPRGDEPTMENDELIFLAEADPYAWANIMQGWSGGTWDASRVKSTDWTEYVTQTSVTQEHSFSASGGTDKLQAYASFGYLDQNGTQRGQEYDRYNTKLSVDIQPNKWFSLGGSINISWSEQDYGMSTLGASSSSGPNSIYAAAQRVYSHAVPYTDEGEIILNPGGDSNVYTIIDEWEKSKQRRQMLRGMGSFYGQMDIGTIFKPLEGLKYRINFGPDYRNWREGVYIDANSVNRLGGTSYARLRNQRDFSWTLDNMIIYNRLLGKHNVGVTLLQTASSWNIETSSMAGENIAKASYLWNAFGTLDVTASDANVSIGSGLTERQLASYMARLNYSFNDKYLLTLSARWDGASQLASGHKWSYFPSAALGWRVDQEQFLANLSWISQLKLRVGVGVTGNSVVDPYQTLGGIQSFFVPFGGMTNEQAYTTFEPNYTSSEYKMANLELGWENTTQYNLGVDFGVFKNRISGTLDFYTTHTEDLLMEMNIPPLTGYSKTYANVGETKNKGVDISLNTINVQLNDFQWSTNLNAAWQKDEIVSLAYGKNDMVDNAWFIGESISVIYGIDADGLWKESDQAEMDQFNANGADFEVGKVKPSDQTDDHIIDSDDRIIIGNRSPRWTVGFNNFFTYKDFELSLMLYGRFGYKVSTGGEGQLGRYNQRKIDYWTPENTDADFQKPIYNEAGGDAYSSLLGYRSGSFLKVRTISLGYNLRSAFAQKIGIQQMKIYAQLKNPGSLYSAIEWLDMDLGGSTYNKGFVFGVDVSF